jgi:hypothetical protein
MNEMGGACFTYGGEMYTGVWLGNPRESDRLEDRTIWENNIKMDLQELE